MGNYTQLHRRRRRSSWRCRSSCLKSLVSMHGKTRKDNEDKKYRAHLKGFVSDSWSPERMIKRRERNDGISVCFCSVL